MFLVPRDGLATAPQVKSQVYEPRVERLSTENIADLAC